MYTLNRANRCIQSCLFAAQALRITVSTVSQGLLSLDSLARYLGISLTITVRQANKPHGPGCIF